MYMQKLLILITASINVSSAEKDFYGSVPDDNTTPSDRFLRTLRPPTTPTPLHTDISTTTQQTQPPPSNNQDETCKILTKNYYLIEAIGLQNTRIQTTIERQANTTRGAINAGLLQLQTSSSCALTTIQNMARKLHRRVTGKSGTSPLNQTETRCGGNLDDGNQAPTVNQSVILKEVERIIAKKVEENRVKLSEIKKAISVQHEQILKKIVHQEKDISKIELQVEQDQQELIRELIGLKGSSCLPKVVELTKKLVNLLKAGREPKNLPEDCTDLQKSGKKSGVYKIKPSSSKTAFDVFCDTTTSGGGWTYLMNRFDGSQDFYKLWDGYKNGFGNLEGEFWLGLEHMHQLTVHPSELLVVLVDWNNRTATAHYSDFSVGSEAERYPLRISGFSGAIPNSLAAHSGAKFSTTDSKNGGHLSCPSKYHAGWWYDACFKAHLTGVYVKDPKVGPAGARGIQWADFPPENKKYTESLRAAVMMVRRKQAV